MTPPPGPRPCRGTSARAPLAAVALSVVLVGFSGYVLLRVADRAPLPPIATPSEPATLPVAAGAATELARIADALDPSPTPVPTATPAPPTRIPTATTFCSDGLRDGTVCQQPQPTPMQPTPYPACSATVEAGSWCRWEGNGP